MQTVNRTLRCADCDHAVVSGVACDWQPAPCPHRRTPIRENRAGRGYTATLSMLPLALAPEYDAIRGED